MACLVICLIVKLRWFAVIPFASCVSGQSTNDTLSGTATAACNARLPWEAGPDLVATGTHFAPKAGACGLLAMTSVGGVITL
jgi:hypothetical protein